MAGLSFIGSYSGIDQATIDQLMQAERIPLNQLTKKKESISGKQDAWKDINTRLNSLFEKMGALKDVNSFDSKVAISSDDKYVSMVAGTSAAEGKYTIRVKELASSSSMIGSQINDITGSLGLEDDRKLTIKSMKNVDGEMVEDPGSSFDITINSGDSLRDVVGTINDTTRDTGVSATIIDGRIVLNDEKTGEREMQIVADQNVLTATGLDAGKWDLNKGEGVKRGNNAIFTLNEIEIVRDSNTIKDAVDGVTINLNKVHLGGESDTVTVSTDTEKATQAIQDFVDQYNSTMDFIAQKTKAGDPKVEGSRGALAGEGSLQRLQASLRTLITGMHRVERSTITDISKLGVTTTDKSGKLSFDKGTFLEALKEDKDNVVNFFNAEGTDKKDVGLAGMANNLIDGFISTKDGIIKSQNESFEKSLKDLNIRIENFEARMVKKEAYYVKTFTALDIAMMKAEGQMSWLQGQVDAMNGGGRR